MVFFCQREGGVGAWCSLALVHSRGRAESGERKGRACTATQGAVPSSSSCILFECVCPAGWLAEKQWRCNFLFVRCGSHHFARRLFSFVFSPSRSFLLRRLLLLPNSLFLPRLFAFAGATTFVTKTIRDLQLQVLSTGLIADQDHHHVVTNTFTTFTISMASDVCVSVCACVCVCVSASVLIGFLIVTNVFIASSDQQTQ